MIESVASWNHHQIPNIFIKYFYHFVLSASQQYGEKKRQQ